MTLETTWWSEYRELSVLAGGGTLNDPLLQARLEYLRGELSRIVAKNEDYAVETAPDSAAGLEEFGVPNPDAMPRPPEPSSR